MIVKDILYKNEDLDYGLNVILKLDDNRNLFFDSVSFSFVDDSNLPNKKWEQYLYGENQLDIVGIYEDELTAYFVLFSNGCILHIYQYLEGSGSLGQAFYIVSPSDSNYKDIYSYMHEDWIDALFSKSDSIDRIPTKTQPFELVPNQQETSMKAHSKIGHYLYIILVILELGINVLFLISSITLFFQYHSSGQLFCFQFPEWILGLWLILSVFNIIFGIAILYRPHSYRVRNAILLTLLTGCCFLLFFV